MRKTVLIISVAIATLLMASCRSTKCIKAVQSSGYSYINDVDEHGNITLSVIVNLDESSAEEIFTKAHTFFVYNYNSSNSVIQQSDKDRSLIIGKGLWTNLYDRTTLGTVFNVSAYHILRIDAKDGKARITVTVQTIDYESRDSKGNVTKGSYNPAILYPYVTVPKIRKAYNTNACIAISINSKCRDLLNKLENDLKHGSTSKSLEDNSW